MGLINAIPFIGMVKMFRMVWIGGRYGGGKTSLAMRIAYELLESGFCRYMLFNNGCVWKNEPQDVKLINKRADAVIVLDEGGLFIRDSRDAEVFQAALRKINVIVILASVAPPATRMKVLRCQRVMNLGAFGFPVWVYQYDLSYMAQKEKGTFFWYKPSEIFGIYDTVSMNEGEEEIINTMMGWSDGLYKDGRKNSRVIEVQDVEKDRGSAELLDAIEENSQLLGNVSLSIRRRS